MRLSQALRLRDGEVIALTGGGGKTAALFRLAEEIVAQGGRALATVTTRLGADQIARAPRHLSSFEANRAALLAALERHGQVLVTGPVDHALGKAAGVSAGLVAEWSGLPGLTAVIVEADGARELPFKAPAAHEPVIPEAATLVVNVAGLSGLGRPLTAEYVHRPEIVAALGGARLGDPVTPELLARVLAHPAGGLKDTPAGARHYLLLNQVETDAALSAARQIAAEVLRTSAAEAVLIGAVGRPAAVREVHARAAAVVLAAGQSTRMGRPKQLLPWAGMTVLGATVRRLRATAVSDIVVVTGAEREAVEAAVLDAAAGDPRVRWVFNPEYAVSEMARSLQCGWASLPADRLGVVVALADQPWLEPAVVAALLAQWRATLAPALAPFFEGQRGNPLLLDRALWPAVQALPAAANPREALRAAGGPLRVDVDTASILRDLDTPADYAQALTA